MVIATEGSCLRLNHLLVEMLIFHISETSMATSSKVIDIRGARLFPFPFLVLGAGFVLAGVGVVVSYTIVGVILIAVGAMMVTAYEGTEIDPNQRTYREYNSFLFLKTGKPRPYDDIEKIYINSGKVNRRMYTAHTSSSSAFARVEYNAYLKLTSGEKIFLFTDHNKKRILSRAKQIAASLSAELQDNTSM